MAVTERYRERTVVDHDDAPIVEHVTDDLPVRSGRPYAIVYYILNVVELLLLLRLIFKALGANASNAFVNFLYAITQPFVAPFIGIFRQPAAQGSVLEWSTIIAMIVYAIVAYAIVQLLIVASSRRNYR
jgi:uncharacterized protein YggT (Ycf19 family)